MVFGPKTLLIPKDRLHLYQVNDSFEMLLCPDRELERDRPGPQTIVNHPHHTEKVGSHPVHLVDEGNAGNVVFVCLTPNCFRLGLYPSNGTENRDGPVEHPERPLDLNGKIHMARGIDDIDPIIAPQTGGSRRSDRYPPLLLLDHPVHRGGSLVHFTDLIVDPRIVENPLSRRSLPRINMGHDADITSLI